MTKCFPRPARRALGALAVAVLLSGGVAQASTIFLFDFEFDEGQMTTFTTSNNGVSATFSSPGAQLGFFVLPSSGLFRKLTNNVLFQGIPADRRLNISFDQDVQCIQLLFGSTAVGQLTLTALDGNLAHVGQSLAASAFLAGSATAEGSISFEGGPFRSLDLTFSSADPDASFAIDDVTNAAEPATLFLLGLGMIALASARKLRRSPSIVPQPQKQYPAISVLLNSAV